MRRILQAVLALALLFHLAIYLTHAWAVVHFPAQMDYGEGAVLCMADVLHRGEPLYRDPNVPPYLIGVYAPLFPALTSLTLGAVPDFAGGRALSILATLFLVGSLGVWAGRGEGRKTMGLAAAALFLANPVVLNWTCYLRVDSLGLLLTTGGLLLAARPRTEPTLGKTDALAAFLFTLAFLDKQNFLAAPLSVAIALGIQNRRLGLKYTLVQGAMVLAALGIFTLATHGMFFRLLFQVNAMPFSFEQMKSYLLSYLPLALCPVVMAIWGMRKAPLVWRIYTVLGLWVVLGSGRAGADFNYFLEFHLGLSVLAAYGLNGRGRPWLSLLAVVQLCGVSVFYQLAPTFYPPNLYLSYEALPLWSGQEPRYMQKGREAEGQILKALAEHPGPVVAENMGHALLAGRMPWMCDPITYKLLSERGMWDEEMILEKLRSGEIKVVIVQQLEHSSRLSDRFLGLVKERYRYLGQIGLEHVFIAP